MSVWPPKAKSKKEKKKEEKHIETLIVIAVYIWNFSTNLFVDLVARDNIKISHDFIIIIITINVYS